ncbi:nucleoporin [Dentipellis sp. KUC8613]|nr:nucleoporin [Dentipellis sp. KUC8613]
MAFAQSTGPSALSSSLQMSTVHSAQLSRHPPLPPKSAPTLDLPALQNGSRILQDYFTKDAQSIPDLGDMLNIPGLPSSASYSVFPDDSRVPYQKRRLITIPDALFQFYNTTEVASHMGIIPEIEKAWIAIDHKLFLWDYVEGQELSTFFDQPDVITKVTAVKPKPGVFVDEINHLLVICTPVSVLLLGVSATDIPGPNNRTRKDIKMYATDMTVSCDVEMVDVAGTDDGRIFLAGSQDGNLYELHYQEKEGWFGKKVQLINHSVGGVQSFLPRFTPHKTEDRIVSVVCDTTRNIIYTLTANSVISLYSPGSDKSVNMYQTIQNLYKLAQDKAPGSPAITPKGFQVIGLHVIEPNESRSGVQLMAITTNGLRLYFAPSAQSYSYYSGNAIEPSRGHRAIQLIHVRLPPVNLLHPDEQSNPNRPSTSGYGSHQPQPPPASRPYILSGLENSVYAAGLTLAAQPGDIDGTDFLLCLAPDLTRISTYAQATSRQPPYQQPQYQAVPYGAPSGPQRPSLTERAALLTIPGRTWGMAPISRPKTLKDITTAPPNTPMPAITNELVYQFLEPPRQFMVLTNAGMSILVRRRALDWLKDAIVEMQADGSPQPLVEFRDSFGRDETCAMLLALASGNTFFDFNEQSALGTISNLSPDVRNIAKQAFYDFGDRPLWNERVTYGSNEITGTVMFSGRREGFALYFSRLIRPVWKRKLVTLGPAGHYVSNLSEDILLMVQKNLYALKEFVDQNPHLFHSTTAGEYAGARAAPANDQEAWKAEQTSVAELQSLLARTIEGASFFLLLNDHRIGDLIAQTDAETQKIIDTLTFEELITGRNGVAASRALVNVIIDLQIGQQIAVDTISDVLQSRCGSFCSTDDVMLYKAKENTRKAMESRNPVERQNHLSESLRLFMKGARSLDFEKLRQVVADYQQLNYAQGAIELPLFCAEVLDLDHQGLQYWHSHPILPPDATSGQLPKPSLTAASGSIVVAPVAEVGKESWQQRARCYDLALTSLEAFELVVSAKGDPEAERVRSHAYELAFASTDEMFHCRLYEWLISRGLADELLEMRPPYLEAYLQRDPPTVDKYQLLWQFYVKDSRPLKAAEVLAALAESVEFPLPLARRLEYLTLAVGNAKAHPISVGGQHESAIAFLTDLEEKLEVAQVQLETYNILLPRLQSRGGRDPDLAEKVDILEKGLYNVTELYQVYAEPYDLLSVKLLILHVSQHRDDKLVTEIWSRLIDEKKYPNPVDAADRIQSQVVPLGQRFFPSDAAFPFRHIALLLVRFQLANVDVVPTSWVPRVLVQCGIPYAEIWDVLHRMYDSQIPPFNTQAAVQTLSAAICILLQDWLEAAKRSSTEFFPVDRIDSAVDVYLKELQTTEAMKATREGYERVRRELRRNW